MAAYKLRLFFSPTKGGMSLTGTEIKALAESYIDETIEDTDALLWINAWLNKLGTNARVFGEVVVNIVDSKEWVSLPANFLAVSQIEKDSGEQYNGTYGIRNGKILMPTVNAYTIWYHKIPTALSTISATPDAHAMLHPIAALYLAARFKAKDDDENPDARRMMKSHDDEISVALQQIDNPKQDGNDCIKVVP